MFPALSVLLALAGGCDDDLRRAARLINDDGPTSMPTGSTRITVSIDQRPRAGQRSPLYDPSGHWVAVVDAYHMPGRDDFPTYWQPRILDMDRQQVYEDGEGFPGAFMVYWAWDERQRLWLYNSDDGSVWWYAVKDGQWNRQRWQGAEPQPPESIRFHLGS